MVSAQFKIHTLPRGPQFFHLKNLSATNERIEGNFLPQNNASLSGGRCALWDPRRGVGAVTVRSSGHHRCSQLRSEGARFTGGEMQCSELAVCGFLLGQWLFIPEVYLPERQIQGLDFAVSVRAELSSHQQRGDFLPWGAATGNPHRAHSWAPLPGTRTERAAAEPGYLSSRCLPPTAHFSRGCPSEGPGRDSGHLR